VANQADGDDQRVADVHAGHGGVRVVQRPDEAAVEVDLAARDADAGQPAAVPSQRRGSRRGRVRSRVAMRCGRTGSLPGGAGGARAAPQP
jgi:hypothetical protein